MPTTLVTGGAGFIGSHVAQELLDRGHTVVVLDDLSGGARDNVPAAAVFVPASVLDVERIEQLFLQYRFDYVFHLAAYAAEGLSHFIRRFNYTNNLIGSVNLINAVGQARRSSCFVFTSSIAVYGAAPAADDRGHRRRSRRIPTASRSTPWSWTCEPRTRCSGSTTSIFRPHNVYGEHQNIGDRYRNVIGIFMNQIMQGQPMTHLRRRRAEPRLQLHQGHLARPGRVGRESPPPTTRCSTWAPTSPAA